MNEHGQIYFAPEDEIPEEDVERLRVASQADLEAAFERFVQEKTVSDPKALALIIGVSPEPPDWDEALKIWQDDESSIPG